MSKLKKLLIAATCCFMLVAGITALTVTGNAGVTTARAAEPTGVDATMTLSTQERQTAIFSFTSKLTTSIGLPRTVTPERRTEF